MSEYIYHSQGEPLMNERGEIYLARADEIMRCRDCAYNAMDTDGICYRFYHEHFNQPDGFCAWGEPREKE